ncbi:MAG: cysteine desulfurase, partial [Clostridia bacterium]|nr:cysteine desulfurase [Clostridia bacterium]
MIKKPVYFDHAATTPVDERVLKKMLPYFSGVFGNAASSHAFGREAVKAVDEARDLIAGIINCKPNELYFTSGGTESDNWALRGVARANGKKGDKIIISPIEHAAVIETAKDLEKDGFVVEYMKVDTFGRVDTENLKRIIDDRTILICCMAANNEVGTIEPIKEIVKIAKERGIIVFTDAVQATGVLKIDVKEYGVDLMSMSSHKIYGPKGAGALYVREGVKIAPLVTGG